MDLSKKPKKTPDYNAKNTEIESKIPSISGLATTTALTAVENKMPYVNNLVKKIQIITQKLMKFKRKLLIIIIIKILPDEFNELTAESFAERLIVY